MGVNNVLVLRTSCSLAARATADADERHNRKTVGVGTVQDWVASRWPVVVPTHSISRQVMMMIAIRGIRGMFRADTRSRELCVAIHRGYLRVMGHRGESGEAGVTRKRRSSQC